MKKTNGKTATILGPLYDFTGDERVLKSPSSLAQFSCTASEYIEKDMIQVNCHLSYSRFQPCLHAAFKRPAQNIKSRRERDAMFVCSF